MFILFAILVTSTGRPWCCVKKVIGFLRLVGCIYLCLLACTLCCFSSFNLDGLVIRVVELFQMLIDEFSNATSCTHRSFVRAKVTWSNFGPEVCTFSCFSELPSHGLFHSEFAQSERTSMYIDFGVGLHHHPHLPSNHLPRELKMSDRTATKLEQCRSRHETIKALREEVLRNREAIELVNEPSNAAKKSYDNLVKESSKFAKGFSHERIHHRKQTWNLKRDAAWETYVVTHEVTWTYAVELQDQVNALWNVVDFQESELMGGSQAI